MSDTSKAVARAEALVAAYVNGGGWGDNEEVLTDILADLMHYAANLESNREIGCSFDTLLDTAARHYAHEVNEEE